VYGILKRNNTQQAWNKLQIETKLKCGVTINSVQQSPFEKIKFLSNDLKNSQFLMEHECPRKTVTGPDLVHITPVRMLIFCFFRLSSHLRLGLPRDPFHSRILTKLLAFFFSYLPCLLHAHLILIYLRTLMWTWWRVKIVKSLLHSLLIPSSFDTDILPSTFLPVSTDLCVLLRENSHVTLITYVTDVQ
jgi:hypothetical protein